MKGDCQEWQYKARRKYRDARIAQAYELTRFSGVLGRIKLRRDHRLLSQALKEVGRVGWLLDLPSGTGRFTPLLEKSAERVVSADISLEMMAVAARSHPSQRVIFLQCSVEELPFQDSCFDLTFTARFLLHLPPALRQTVLCELSRVSKRWVLFDCMMEGGLKGRLRRFRKARQKEGKAKKRMGKEELMWLLHRSGLEVHCIYRPSRFFSEKWMILCQKNYGPFIRGKTISPRDYQQVEISSFRGFMKDPWPSSISLQELLGEVGQPAGVIVKMRRCRAIKIRQDLHVKEEFLTGWQDWPRRLKGLLHRSRLKRQWSAILLARERGVPTPEPLAYLEEKRGLLPSKSLLVTRYESNYMTLSHYLRGKIRETTLAPHHGEGFLKELARAVRSMHEQGMLHRDLKGSNILVREDGEAWSFQFTDLKASRFRREAARVFSPAGAARQDIIRLLATLRSFFSETDRRSFLHSYLSSASREAQRVIAEWGAEALKKFPPRGV